MEPAGSWGGEDEEVERVLNKNSSIIGAVPDMLSPSVNTSGGSWGGVKVGFVETAFNGKIFCSFLWLKLDPLSPSYLLCSSFFISRTHSCISQ